MLTLTRDIISVPVPLSNVCVDLGAAGDQRISDGAGLSWNSVCACKCREIKAGSV